MSRRGTRNGVWTDPDLRIGLWNALSLSFWNRVQGDDLADGMRAENRAVHKLCRSLWLHYFKKPLDTLQAFYWAGIYKELRDYFFGANWHEIYDFIEFVAQYADARDADNVKAFCTICNFVLERELSGYRFVGNQIVQLTDDEELAALEEATQSRIPPVRAHLARAAELLFDRKNPDFRNSIKESISAVEAACKIIVGTEKGDLTHALDRISAKVELHPALKSGLSKLYGYTSDEKGIRHALMEEATAKFDDAKFMLVSCATFCNYLIAKAAAADIL